MEQSMPFGEVLEAIENLSLEEQETLIDILHRRVAEQGRKKLAYEIRGSREGYYYLLYFTAPTSRLSELWREYHLNEDLLRFLTLKTSEVKEAIPKGQQTEQISVWK